MADIILLTDPHGKALTNAPPGLGFSILSQEYLTLEGDNQLHIVVRGETLHSFVMSLGKLGDLHLNLKIEFARAKPGLFGERPSELKGLLYHLRRLVESSNTNIPRIILVGWSLDEARDYVDKVYGIQLIHDLTYNGGRDELETKLLHEKATIRNKSILDSLVENSLTTGRNQYRFI